MDDGERVKRFRANFGRLQRNREKVPLEQLRTTYAKKYDALVAEVAADADWYADRCLEHMTRQWPRHPKDGAGNKWLDRKAAAIIREEAAPGGTAERWRAAIIDDLNMDAYMQLVWDRYARLEREAFGPYWERHCRRVGEPGEEWTYNDIIQRFWLPPGQDPDRPRGAWIDSEGNVYTTRWPPGTTQ